MKVSVIISLIAGNSKRVSRRQSAAKLGNEKVQRLAERRTLKRVETGDTLRGEDIVSSTWKHVAAKAGKKLAILTEGNGLANSNIVNRHVIWRYIVSHTKLFLIPERGWKIRKSLILRKPSP
jgi:hypothetical protein